MKDTLIVLAILAGGALLFGFVVVMDIYHDVNSITEEQRQ